MKTMHKTGSVLALAALLALGGCETMAPANTSAGTAYPQSSYGAYTGYGVVQSIELVQQANTGLGAGAVAFTSHLKVRRWFAAAIPLLLIAGNWSAVTRAAWPDRLLTSAIAAELQKVLGVTVTVENRPGGSTAIGTLAVERAPPDGLTLLVTSDATFTGNPHMTE